MKLYLTKYTNTDYKTEDICIFFTDQSSNLSDHLAFKGLTLYKVSDMIIYISFDSLKITCNNFPILETGYTSMNRLTEITL